MATAKNNKPKKKRAAQLTDAQFLAKFKLLVESGLNPHEVKTKLGYYEKKRNSKLASETCVQIDEFCERRRMARHLTLGYIA